MTLDQARVLTPNKQSFNAVESTSSTAFVKAPKFPKSQSKKGDGARLSEESTGSVPLVSASLINNKFFIEKEAPIEVNPEESYLYEDRESRPSTEAVPIVSSKQDHQEASLIPFGAAK